MVARLEYAPVKHSLLVSGKASLFYEWGFFYFDHPKSSDKDEVETLELSLEEIASTLLSEQPLIISNVPHRDYTPIRIRTKTTPRLHIFT